MENHQHESAQSPFEDIKNNIKTYRSNGHFVEAARLIEDLPKNFRCSRVVAIEAAQLYLVQGQFRLAAETCDNVSEPTFADLKSESFALSSQDEDAVAFELLRAYIWIGRFSKLKTALKIAQRLGSAWNLDKPVIPGTIADSSKEAEDGGLLISSTNEGLEKEALGRNIPQISEYRVLMVFYYWKIMVVAAEQGLLDESATKAAALMPISSLRRALQVMNRLREARFLVYFEIGLIKTPEEAMQQLQGFLKTLDSDKWDTERALTLADIFELQLQSSDEVILAKAQDTFEEAQKIFNKISHAFGNIDLDLARVSFDRTISAGEKFVRKTSIVDRYFQAGHYQNGIRCLTSAVSHETLDDPYVGQLISAIKLLQQKVDEVGSEILQQLALIHSVCQASLNASEYGFVLKALEPYYANVPEEIGPKNHSNIAMAMAMVYGSFGSNMKALKAAEESLEIAKSGTSYETCSDAALLLGRFRLAVSEQYPTESAEAMKWLSSAMDILKEWIEKDSENGYINGEIQKCLLVGGWENMRVIRQSELKSTPVEKPWIERVKKLLSSPTDVLKQNDVIDLEIRVLMRQQNFLESSKLSADYLNDLDRLPSVSPRIKAQAYEALQLAVKQRWSSLDLAYKSLQLWRQTNGSEAIIIKTNFFGDILSEAVQMIPEDSKRELLRRSQTHLARNWLFLKNYYEE
ncbi:hypothetical protein TASIC1_0010043900 [Trichoderma asperellum]|uniref:Uncharacterized protein n=1 Tax=Trichoderma asperellum TaxID=101201 RepID=A0A6V8R6K9_TRIAP|nr:hypothetical protein TASIC1_0010043900 [Trichoderma asperellum]